ncbi:MAG: peptidylprolyl isomerase [Ruminococcaceae bacterium]|nr:peptidylprolyl isomerase [Oscillospiraceae bacterium]
MKLKKFVALIIVLSCIFSCFVSCGDAGTEELGTGYSLYATTRDITGRDVSYVEMCVENYGKVIILVDATSAPKTVENFLSLVNSGFYDGLTFHRVIKDFMIQGGDPNGDGTGHVGTAIKGEFSANGFENDIHHYPGVISMARLGDDMDSATSQFFICNADARESLDGQYAAFGYVVVGMSVIEKITEEVFPKTALADFYGDYNYHPAYGVPYHYLWNYYGNGTIEENKDKPVIRYIKVLEDYDPSSIAQS